MIHQKNTVLLWHIYLYLWQKVELAIFNMCPIWNNNSFIIDFMAYTNSIHTAAYYLANTNITTNDIISTMPCEEMRFGHWCTSDRRTSSYKATKKSKWMLESYHHKTYLFLITLKQTTKTKNVTVLYWLMFLIINMPG